jgi:hypothetical protein
MNRIPDGLPPPYEANYAASEITASSGPPTPTTTASLETAREYYSPISPALTRVEPPPEPKFRAKVSHSSVCPASTSISSELSHSTLTQSHVHNSKVTHSRLVSSTVTDGTMVKHCNITNSLAELDSEIANSKVEASTIRNARIFNCTIRNSVVEGGEYKGMKIIDQNVQNHDFLGLKDCTSRVYPGT